MSKYINADELIKKVKREIDDCKDAYGRLGTIERYVASGAERVLTILDKMPSADVAEIVRCKDCKHLFEIDPDNLYVCARIDFGMDGEPSFLNPENDFCSRGERKESKVKKCFDIPKEVAEMLLEDTERKESK